MKEMMNAFFDGNLDMAYNLFGARLDEVDGIHGVTFRTWAPNAVCVKVVGDFNQWNGDLHCMSKIDNRGIFSIFIPHIGEFETYKYYIEGQDGIWRMKADPFAFYSEKRPNTGSLVYNINGFPWFDGEWMESRKNKVHYEEPMNIYEMHLGSWLRKGEEEFFSYEELAQQVIPYVKGMGYNYIEFMPVMEHPFDGSWGYQMTGYFSATSRYGDPKKLMYFIDQCHQNDIGVILDWVPVHFCRDAHGLIEYDGSCVFEYPFPDLKENELWGTRHFDLGKNEIISFLISSANYWFDYFHADGIRVDAVSNIIHYFGDSTRGVNQKGVEFLQKLNASVHRNFEGALMIAEDSSSYPKVTEPAYNGGLGFDFKWNMGWMNDILKYMETEPEHRRDQHSKFTFSMMYAYNEKFILPFSHDEVVHGKKSLVNKMPGDYWQKFANLRLLLGYMYSHPGKKLLFMGSEFAQFTEWNENKSLEWELKQYPAHDAFTRFVHDLNNVYAQNEELYAKDQDYTGFEWIDVNNTEQSIYSFIRHAKNEQDIVIVCNFKPIAYHNYRIGVGLEGDYEEILNSDLDIYNGSNVKNMATISTEEIECHGKSCSIAVSIPPLGIIMLKHKK